MNFIRFLKKIEINIDKCKSFKETCLQALNYEKYDDLSFTNADNKDSKQLKESINLREMIKERKPKKKSLETLIFINSKN